MISMRVASRGAASSGTAADWRSRSTSTQTYPIVARILRGRGFDAVSANEAGHGQASDREQLDFAVAGRRALVTFNVADFAREAQA